MNLPTFLVAAVVAVIFLAIIIRGIRNLRQGKSGCACGGDCAHCKGCH